MPLLCRRMEYQIVHIMCLTLENKTVRIICLTIEHIMAVHYLFDAWNIKPYTSLPDD